MLNPNPNLRSNPNLNYNPKPTSSTNPKHNSNCKPNPQITSTPNRSHYGSHWEKRHKLYKACSSLPVPLRIPPPCPSHHLPTDRASLQAAHCVEKMQELILDLLSRVCGTQGGAARGGPQRFGRLLGRLTELRTLHHNYVLLSRQQGALWWRRGTRKGGRTFWTTIISGMFPIGVEGLSQALGQLGKCKIMILLELFYFVFVLLLFLLLFSASVLCFSFSKICHIIGLGITVRHLDQFWKCWHLHSITLFLS